MSARLIRPFLAVVLILGCDLRGQIQPASHCVVPSNGAPALPAKLLTGQGSIHFPITTANPDAQKFFEQGVAQMHSFWSREAERSFLQAAALDPQAPMPWWGVAMVAAGDYRPHFQLVRDKGSVPKINPPMQRALDAAKKAAQLAAVPGKATDLEKLYVASTTARREHPLNDAAADKAYIAKLREIIAAFPEEVEARTYLALHLMDGFTTPDRKPRPGTMEAVAILKELAQKAPEHPGVHHYVIHGWEGSSFAKDAWLSCERYAALVPEIPHALHMPGHIYSQTGKLDEARQSFTVAGNLERAYMRADKDYGNGHHGHNIHYLAAVNAAAGRYDDAIAAAQELLAISETEAEKKQLDNSRTAYRQGWFAMLRTLVWAERWDNLLSGSLLPAYNKPREQAWMHWARGIAFAAKGDAASARSEASALRQALLDYEQQTKSKIPKELGVAEQELHGHLVLASGKVSRGLKILEAASSAERALRYNEPAFYPRPVAEAWGDASLRANQLKMAEKAFRIAVHELPGSVRGERGLKQALSQSMTRAHAHAQ